MMWTKRKVMDILENHERETKCLERQVIALRMALSSDLSNIRHKAYPSGVNYDIERVQSSFTRIDEKLTAVVMESDRRRDQYQRDMAAIRCRMADIHCVYSAILCLKSESKTILLNLYYPRQTAKSVADMMGTQPRTVWRLRNKALDDLVNFLKKI